ncbi:MAG: YkgJ family cysteine cluster protein [Desulfovibrionaceae bacterium]|nr:YkgJ family cysteine cluster protein [Desulfovibrionaceae bacterium]
MDPAGDPDRACRRCGECCKKGGPALHKKDLGLIGPGRALGLKDLVTLRAGEPVHDQPRGAVLALDSEVVKIRPAPGSAACVFYQAQDSACGIYPDRPLECRLLDCRDTSAIEAEYHRDRLSRADALGPDNPLLELVREHEKNCPAGRLAELVHALDGVDAQSAALELGRMLRYDAEMRRLSLERAGLSPDQLDFFFGRAPEEVLGPLGVRLDRSGPTPRLTLGRTDHGQRS